MATLRERIENSPAVFFLGAIVAGFLAGIGAYQAVLEISDLTTISRARLAVLEQGITCANCEPTMSAIQFDMDRHGDDIGASLTKRYPGECQNACADEPECKAWAFEPPNICWLKRGTPSGKPRPDYASGVKN